MIKLYLVQFGKSGEYVIKVFLILCHFCLFALNYSRGRFSHEALVGKLFNYSFDLSLKLFLFALKTSLFHFEINDIGKGKVDSSRVGNDLYGVVSTYLTVELLGNTYFACGSKTNEERFACRAEDIAVSCFDEYLGLL